MSAYTEYIVKEFDQSVKNKFNVYNSLFLSLPFRKISNIGILIPLMQEACKKGLDAGKEPLPILDSFFESQAELRSEEERIDFIFRVIQYIERQIVLYDSVEDAAFPHLLEKSNELHFKDFINLIQRQNKKGLLDQKLQDFSARIVLTAHPTQFYPPAVLDIINRLRILINQNDINGIDLTLQQLGLTSFINSRKPTPLDEARNIIYFLRNVYYEAIGALFTQIKKESSSPQTLNPQLFCLGFWPGGDRDGNPFVTADITRAVADELRITLMKCYYQDIKNLESKLTFRAIEETLAELRKQLYAALFDPATVLSFHQIMNPLEEIRETLIAKYNGLFLEDLDLVIDKVRIFRTHFACLDIRQDHSVHLQTITEILKNNNRIREDLTELSQPDLLKILIHEQFDIRADQFSDPLVQDTIKTISLLQGIQEKNGEQACNRYIISNSEDIYSVLFVYALFRWCGVQAEDLKFDIIPLFESMQGMKNSENIMKNLFDIPDYESHLDRRSRKQTIMLGFSDGTKDGGYLLANWSIFKTKESLSELCRERGIKALFFDGRGGPPARGGGKTHSFYAAQSEKIANHEIQLTIQGQTISSKYGTRAHFMHNCEQLLTAGISNSLIQKGHFLSKESRDILENLSRLSFEKYEALKNHPLFLPYLENKSTLKYYGQANIGSRPAKRGNQKKLELKDLRAISFVGSWSQLKQNVPGYYGMGTALQSYVKSGKLGEIQRLFQEVPFFKALLLNSMMSLSKSNFKLTSYMRKDPIYGDFWQILLEEYQLTREMVLLVSGYSMLMEEEPVSRNSVAIREQIVLPLLVIQQYALQKIEEGSAYREAYEKIVTRSLYGNINASRNSA